MRVRVWIERTNETREVELPEDARIADLLERLGIPAEDVFVVINDTIQPEDAALEDGVEVKLLSVVSGG